jgi:signal transduction histidine kinase
LRTPIAELRAAAEIAQRWPDPELSQRLSADALAISRQMGGFVEGLLELAVLESEEQSARLERFDLVPALEHLLARAQAQCDRSVTIVRELPGELQLLSNRSLWEVALRNLVDNACSHSPPVARIHVRAAADGDGARVTISNPTEGLEADDVLRCRERLWRKDRSADGSQHHFGLGLSIVEAACARLGHDFSVRLEDGVFHASIARSRHGPTSPPHARPRAESAVACDHATQSPVPTPHP